MQGWEVLREKYNLSAQIVKIILFKIAFDEWKAVFRDEQPRGPDGRWIIGGGKYVISERHTTGNKQIDSITEKITDALDVVLSQLGPGSGSLYGTYVHSSAAKLLRGINIPGIGKDGIEQSFSLGDLVRYGLSDSIRTDALLRNDQTGEILAVWDIKTGSQRLSPKRVAKIRNYLNISDDVPVIDIHINLGIIVKNHDI
ncbi:hypothetical protein ACFQE0_07115 [Methylobacterium komagatae]|uniref:PD-(D/E)XK endonuclease-like domain-containing protein n=1 Tax=Methylobacterium komagatae TaxID=374425 RepID=A0ABW2BH59_9HYPH